MGHMLLVCNCINCGVLMGCNPNYVPSIRVDGKREPLCKDCFAAWNEFHRTSKGLEPVALHPEAYEPAEEY